MRKTALVAIVILFCVSYCGCGSKWTEETACQEAFKNVQYKIDVSKYPAFDPDFQENQKAIQAGQERVGDRFVTRNDEPPIEYVVSRLDEKERPTITMFYGRNRNLLSVRLFSSLDYPRVSYIYCVEDNLRIGDKVFRTGELMSVSFRPSQHEEYYFLPDRHCTGHMKF